MKINLLLCLLHVGAFSSLPHICSPPQVFGGATLFAGEWEITEASERSLERGLEWLARNQGPKGCWDSNDLGLVGMGTLAFLAAGHTPGRGKYGHVVEKAIGYIVDNAKPSGLLNVSNARRDMYNHGMATFAVGQAYGMTADPRLGQILDRALKLIANTQCDNGGWDYVAKRQGRGHDLSLVVMQAKALRGAVDSGLEVPPEVIDLAIESVRGYYRTSRGSRNLSLQQLRSLPGQFTYEGQRASLAMAACGVVCLQEFGEYSDWRIPRNMDVISKDIQGLAKGRQRKNGTVPFDAYTMYYVSQAVYQVGGRHWKRLYPQIRDAVVKTQHLNPGALREHGKWAAGKHVSGRPGDLYGTAVACFVLAIPNRYLPILQEIRRLEKEAGGGRGK